MFRKYCDHATILTLIENALPGARINIEDLGDGEHLSVRVISEMFSGKSRVEQHKMLLDVLREAATAPLPRLAVQTGTP
ncbi:BolA/IbaG family iron-sulfur metabolism protein [Phaeovibrio sulfidiphilus]|uniref:BolA/IbaG family iron-sulfur metabolism protein n=1 Tax=Phaeovibrio sulfidiphilus TaxID=1220600 RepID=A0A8J7CQI1_9PROT|nr:BolA/IbaG family iron-sulfur metabolism protein [Phaeovibrio sulfidiphilus]MBE1236855.1 BolA/IbaG family iron-sulfur metabolism protein [Phaeovibrio sulfidiphilus]